MSRPTGTHGISLDQLKTMLASSSAFLQETGGTPQKAKSHVHFGRRVGSPPRPFVQLELQDARGEALHEGSRNVLLVSGSIRVHFERETQLAAEDPYLDFVDWLSRVIDETNEQAGDEDGSSQHGLTHLPLINLDLASVGENRRDTWQSLGRFYTAEAIWTWGDQ